MVLGAHRIVRFPGGVGEGQEVVQAGQRRLVLPAAGQHQGQTEARRGQMLRIVRRLGDLHGVVAGRHGRAEPPLPRRREASVNQPVHDESAMADLIG